MKRKSIILVACIFIVAAVAIALIVKPEHKDTTPMLSNGLTVKQNTMLAEFYHLECDKNLAELGERDTFTFFMTDKTEEVVRMWAYFVYGNQLTGHALSDRQNQEINRYNQSIQDALILSEDPAFAAENISSTFVVQNPGAAYVLYENLPEDIYQKILWRGEDDINLMQYIEYGLFYQIGIDQLSQPLQYDGKKPLEADGMTELTVSVFNEFFWSQDLGEFWQYGDISLDLQEYVKNYIDTLGEDDFEDVAERASGVMQVYGFSESNPITVEWLLENPKDAHKLILDLPRDFSFAILAASKGDNLDTVPIYARRTDQLRYMLDLH